MQDNSNSDLLFFDESRFGNNSKLGYGWFPKGKRSRLEIKLGYKNFYLYSAVNVKNGENFTFLMPNVNTDCMNIYLKELSKSNKNKKLIIVMDGASWHKSKDLQEHENIKIILLPPYSPELNPVERLWQYIKNQTIKNKVYKKLEDLENDVSEFIKNISSDTILSICKINYLLN